MNIKKLTLNNSGYPEPLRQFKSPPTIYSSGAPLADLMKRPRVAIVGSRKHTPYGTQVTQQFAAELAEQGVVIISGLAFGIDAIAHHATVEVGGLAIAVLPSPLDNVLPVTNRRLAQQILDTGGTLVSEYAPGDAPQKQNFIARNRIVSGLADAVLITEANQKSGSLHTAQYAIDQGKELLIVPGSILSASSAGTNNLLKAFSATPVTSTHDVLITLGLEHHETKAKDVRGRNANEQAVLDLMLQGITAANILLEHSKLEVSKFNQVLTMLEISGKIRPLGANNWGIA